MGQKQDIGSVWQDMRRRIEETPALNNRFEQTIYGILAPVMDYMQIEQDALRQRLEQSGSRELVYQYAFELFITDYQEEEDASFIEIYLQECGADLSPFAAEFLQHLNTSAMRLWLIAETAQEQGITLIAIDSETEEKIHITADIGDKAAAGQYLLTRVLTINSKTLLGLSMLILPQKSGEQVESYMQEMREEIISHFETAGQDEGGDISPEYLEIFAAESIKDSIAQVSFNLWVESLADKME